MCMYTNTISFKTTPNHKLYNDNSYSGVLRTVQVYEIHFNAVFLMLYRVLQVG